MTAAADRTLHVELVGGRFDGETVATSTLCAGCGKPLSTGCVLRVRGDRYRVLAPTAHRPEWRAYIERAVRA